MTDESVNATTTIGASAGTVFAVTLTYDWSEVGPSPRRRMEFPPFAPDHLDNSLRHLAAIVVHGDG